MQLSRGISTSVLAAAAAEAQGPQAAGGFNWVRWTIIAGVIGGGLYSYALFNSSPQQQGSLVKTPSTGSSHTIPKEINTKVGDYVAVKKAIQEALESDTSYDDGSYGPILVRLAWHASGTYDAKSGTGGSNGATMRFPPESVWAANAGLKVARELLEPIKQRFPWITYADLWTLAGATAVEEMGGPHIRWRPGRKDLDDGTTCPPDGRLPDASQGAAHVRAIFGRMGFTDQEMVALSGAHSLGRCHTSRSGYDGPWTNAPTTFSNLYFQELFNRTWVKRKWDGPLQYQDKEERKLMMLPTDMALVWDRGFKKYAQQYAKDEDKFFQDFAAAFSKLLELGVPYPEGAQYI